MPRYSGADMDIVVEDETGHVERWLRQQCDFPALPPHHSADGIPSKVTYEFEVKSTFGACSTTMFMSHNQYERVSIPDSETYLLTLTNRVLDATSSASRSWLVRYSLRACPRIQPPQSTAANAHLRGSSAPRWQCAPLYDRQMGGPNGGVQLAVVGSVTAPCLMSAGTLIRLGLKLCSLPA